MTGKKTFSRRKVLFSMTSVGTLSVLSSPFSIGAAFAADTMTVGFVYVGAKDDFGYNQSHAEGAAAIKSIPGVTVIEEEKVSETVDVEKTMESMINLDDSSLLFLTSFGYFSHMLKVADKYKNITFRHCGGLWDQTQHPVNTGSYFGYIDEAQYLSGIVAAYATKTKKFGFVAAIPIPQVLRNINSFTLGAQSVDPSITTQVIFTGGWSEPIKEAEATNSLIDQGVDVVTCHVDGPKVIVETAEKRGVYTCGYHTSQASLAPKGYLTGAEWNWAKVYTDYITGLMNGDTQLNLVRGGLKEGIVKTSAYGPAVSAEARKHADAVKAQFMDGSFVIYKGEIKDNKGNIIIAAGESHPQKDIVLEFMDYLVAGVIGDVRS